MMRIKDYAKKFYFATGNKKLKPTNDIKYLIWSIPAIVTCPNATDECKNKCYATKAERQYKNALRSRRKNWDFSKGEEFVDDVTNFIHLKAKNWKNAKKIVVRIHESGDFYSKEYFLKWVEIASRCKDIDNVIFMAYTKSLPFIVGVEVPSNLFIRSSIWSDTSEEMLALTEELGLPIYTACESEEWNGLKKRNQCDCVCCSTCNKCWSHIEKLYCEIH